MAKLHIEQQATPDLIYDYLDIIESEKYNSMNEVYDAAYEMGYNLGEQTKTNIPPTLKRLKIVEESNPQKLTKLGKDLVKIMLYDHELYCNILHFIYSSAYERDPTAERLISWSYKHVTRKIFEMSPIDNFVDIKQDIVDSVEYTAREKSRKSDPGFEEGESYTFSTTSINGYKRYIEMLDPPVLTDDGGIKLRTFVPPELLLLSIDHIYRTNLISESTYDYGDLVELSDNVREELCTFCLLSDEHLEKMLNLASRNYDILNVESDYAIRLRLSQEVNLDYIL